MSVYNSSQSKALGQARRHTQLTSHNKESVMQSQDRRFDSGTDDARCSDTAAAATRREEARLQGARGVASSMGHPADAADPSGDISPDGTANPAAVKEVPRLHGDA